MSLSTLFEISDKEMFELVDEEFGLSQKQAVLNGMIDNMMNQLEKLKKSEEKTKTEIKRLRQENDLLHNIIKNKSK